MSRDQTQSGIRVVSRDASSVTVVNNKRRRLGVTVSGCPEPENAIVVPASGPRDWKPEVTIPCDPDISTLTCVLEMEGPQGARPHYSGPFEPDETGEKFVFHPRRMSSGGDSGVLGEGVLGIMIHGAER